MNTFEELIERSLALVEPLNMEVKKHRGVKGQPRLWSWKTRQTALFSKAEHTGETEKVEEDYDFNFKHVHFYIPVKLQ